MSQSSRSIPAAEALPAKAQTADLSTLLAQLTKLGLDFAAEALSTLLTRAVKEDLAQLPQLRQNITDFQVLFHRNSLLVGPSSGRTPM